MILVINIDGRVELASNAACERLGICPGENLYALAADAGSRLRKYVVRCAQTKRVCHCSLKLERDQVRLHVRCHASPMRAAPEHVPESVLLQCEERNHRPPLARRFLHWHPIKYHRSGQPAGRADDRLQRELTQRDLLFSEVKHRLKNNIQMVMSMLMTAQRRAASEEARSTLQTTVMKLQAAILVHKLLEDAGEQRHVRADYFLRELCRAIQNASPRRFALAIEADVSELSTAVVPSLGLIVNELLTNAIKHGIHDDRGLIRVALKSEESQLELRVEDSGPGFAAGASEGSGSGLGLVQALASHLHGTFHVESAAGARCIVRLPSTVP